MRAYIRIDSVVHHSKPNSGQLNEVDLKPKFVRSVLQVKQILKIFFLLMKRSLPNRFLLVTCGILFGTANVQAKLCPTEVSNGMVTSSCSRVPGDECTFTCNTGFKKAVNVSIVKCGSDGNWTYISTACVDAKAICPQNFKGGMFHDCQYSANETCSYACFSPFRRNTQIPNATCVSDGGWNQNTQKLCARTCGMSIRNGYLNSACTSSIRETCTFQCNLGFKETSLVRKVTCNESGEWEPAEPCTELLCPATIKNGTVNAMVCNRRIYSECPFTCNPGFDPNPKSTKLFCGIYGNWIETATPSCLERQGLCINVIDNGRWVKGCRFQAKETCAFECDRGFQINPNITGDITCTLSGIWNVDPKLLCISYEWGLITTLIPDYGGVYIQTVPIMTDGAPKLDSNKKLSFAANLWFLSVDGDYALRQAYVYDYYSATIYRDSNFSIGLSGENKWTTIHRGVSKGYVKLAVDWISHNIYWTDPQYKWIAVQSLVSNDTFMYRVLIDDNLEATDALALDPMEALLFWSDIGSFTKIEVSSLSGKSRKCLISSNLITPFSLAADYGTRRIYWVDPSRYTLESITYEGKERQILLRNSDSSFYDLAVYKDYLYVTDSVYKYVHFLNKTNKETLKESLSGIGETYLGVTVFHPEAQPTSATASCVNYGCDHMCVTEKSGASCLCRDGYTLNKDLKTCSVNNEYFHRGLVFSNDSSICIVDIRVLTHFSYDPKCLLNINGTRYMVMDTDQRQIIIANDTSIYWAMVDNLVLHVLTKPSGSISGLAWDGYDRNMYWSELDTGIIWRLSRESDKAIVFLSGLIGPRSILILSHERLLYWISDRNGSRIEYCSLDGSNHQIILYNDLFETTTYLAYDMHAKRIYYLASTTNGVNYVYSCKLDGSDLTYSFRSFKRLAKLELYKGHMVLTSNTKTGTLLMSFYTDLSENTISGVFPGVGNISSIKVFDENFRQNETGPCYNFNGGCEQICLSSGKSRICECAFGFKLAPNGKNCLTDPIKDNFMLIRDGTHNSIYQISLTDQTVRGINSKVMEDVTDVIYSPVDDLVIWGTVKSEISMIHLNGTGQRIFLISEENIFYQLRFAVDISTGNIYYTAVNYMQYSKRYQSHIGVILPNGKNKKILTGLSYPHGIAVYQSKGLMFYTDIGYKTYIGQSNMEGTQASVLLELSHDKWPSELTIDYKNDYLYWFDQVDGSIQYCKLDGTRYQTFVKYPDDRIDAFVLYQDYMYLTTENRLSMQKVKISNPNETTKFATYAELGSIQSIRIYSSMVQSKNAFCSVGNGGCSTFCFPSAFGRLCSCEDGVHRKDGIDTLCSNTVQCPVMMGTIVVSNDCQRINGSPCNFTCTQGYRPRQDVKNVLCSGMSYSPADSCEEILCPSEIPNGFLIKGNDGHECSRAVGTRCEFEWNIGFDRKPPGPGIFCHVDGWSPASVCTASPSMLLASKSEVNQAALGSGVGIGVTIVIIIIVVSVFFTFKRRKHNLAFAPKRMQEEVMNATFGPEPGNEFAEVSYENGAVNIINARKTEEPHNLTPHSINTGRDVSRTYDESMLIPRPRAKENPRMNKF